MHKHSESVLRIASFHFLSGLPNQLLLQPLAADFSVRSVSTSRSPVLTESTGEHLGVVATIGGEDASTMSMASDPHLVHEHPHHTRSRTALEAVLGG